MQLFKSAGTKLVYDYLTVNPTRSEFMRDMALSAYLIAKYTHAPGLTRAEIALRDLTLDLQVEFKKTIDELIVDFSDTLMKESLSRVNWNEIANHLLDIVTEDLVDDDLKAEGY